MPMHCEPANSIITKFGGVDAVAAIVDTTAGQVRRWRRTKEKGGTGGIVPHWHVEKLVSAAQARRIKLKPADFAPVIELARAS